MWLSDAHTEQERHSSLSSNLIFDLISKSEKVTVVVVLLYDVDNCFLVLGRWFDRNFLSKKDLYGSAHDCFQNYLGSDFVFGKILGSNRFFFKYSEKDDFLINILLVSPLPLVCDYNFKVRVFIFQIELFSSWQKPEHQ